MAFVAGLPSNYNILSPLAFRLDIERVPMATFFCQSVSVPGVTLGEIEQITPIINIPIPGDKMEFESLTATFLIDEDLANYLEIWNWMRALGGVTSAEEYARRSVDGDMGITEGGGLISDATLTILTNSMNANKSVVFEDCFPTSLGALSLMTSADSIDAITCDVSFSFRDFIITNVN